MPRVKFNGRFINSFINTPFLNKSMIDGAAFIGVGFDGRGDYSPESRKMSIVQRDCSGRST